MSILKEIYEYKKNFVEQQKNKCSQKEIENQLIIDKNRSFKFYKKLKYLKNIFIRSIMCLKA